MLWREPTVCLTACRPIQLRIVASNSPYTYIHSDYIFILCTRFECIRASSAINSNIQPNWTVCAGPVVSHQRHAKYPMHLTSAMSGFNSPLPATACWYSVYSCWSMFSVQAMCLFARSTRASGPSFRAHHHYPISTQNIHARREIPQNVLIL